MSDAARHDDLATVIAIAALAACTSAIAHEAIGHGGACLLSGGRITLLNNAFFQCSHFGRYISVSGPTGNVVAGVIAFAGQCLVPARYPALRLYLLLVMAFSLFWEAGYLIEAMVRDSGDSVFAYRELVGPETGLARGVAIAIGVVGYFLVGRMLRVRAAVFAGAPGLAERMLRAAWLTGIVVMAGAAALYAPDRLGAVRDAGLSIVASFPLLLRFPAPDRPRESASLINRSPGILLLGLLAAIAFAATMGRGVTS